MSFGKYGRITTERGHIPEDEPVFLLRAHDPQALPVLEEYKQRCTDYGSPEEHVLGVDAQIARFANFMAEHPDRMKAPGTEAG